MEVAYIEMNSQTALDRFSEEDHLKLYHGAYLSADELNRCRGISASCGMRVNDNVKSDYRVIYVDGSFEDKSW
jgi:hypothetical protein